MYVMVVQAQAGRKFAARVGKIYANGPASDVKRAAEERAV